MSRAGGRRAGDVVGIIVGLFAIFAIDITEGYPA